MEFIRWISRVYNIHKRWLLVVTVILTLFHLLCIGLAVKEYIPDGASIGSVIWDFHADCILLSEPFIRRTIDQVIAQMLMWLTICIWIYAAPRFARGHEELKGYLFEITGVKDNNQEIKGFIEEARELWDQQELWACTIPQICKKERPGISITKMCYMLGWVAMLVLTYLIPVRQNYIPLRQPFSIYWLQALLTLIFGVVSVGICMFSWWCCMEYAFFLSRVSALKSLTVPYGYTYYVKKRKRNNGFWTELWKANNERTAKDYLLIKCGKVREDYDQPNYYFNSAHPSETHALIRMLHDSTLTTLAFLVVSVIFTLQYGCCVWAERIHIGNSFVETIWLINVIIPGVFSLLPVVLCPKLFILRIHRIWRLHLLKDYEERLQYYTSYSDIEGVADIRAERQYWSQKIDEVEKDRLDVRNFETIGAILSILLNVGVIVATLVS